MSSIRDIIGELKAAGVDDSVILSVVEKIDGMIASVKPGPSKGAERTRRWREKQQASQSVTCDVARDAPSSLKDPEPNPSTVENNPNPPPPYSPPATRKSRDGDEIRRELSTVLSSDRVEAVIAHRQKLRKPMTVHAAHLLAGKFGQVANPDDAADAMVANGWQGFEPDWMNRQQRGPPQRPSKVTNADLIQHYAEQLRARHEPASDGNEEGGAGEGFRGSPVAGAPLFERPGLEREFAGKTIDLVPTRSDRH
jgi:hypothetical protein